MSYLLSVMGIGFYVLGSIIALNEIEKKNLKIDNYYQSFYLL